MKSHQNVSPNSNNTNNKKSNLVISIKDSNMFFKNCENNVLYKWLATLANRGKKGIKKESLFELCHIQFQEGSIF